MMMNHHSKKPQCLLPVLTRAVLPKVVQTLPPLIRQRSTLRRLWPIGKLGLRRCLCCRANSIQGCTRKARHRQDGLALRANGRRWLRSSSGAVEWSFYHAFIAPRPQTPVRRATYQGGPLHGQAVSQGHGIQTQYLDDTGTRIDARRAHSLMQGTAHIGASGLYVKAGRVYKWQVSGCVGRGKVTGTITIGARLARA